MADRPQPNPTKLEKELPVSRVAEHRAVDNHKRECEHYNDCLLVAAKKAWPGFTCARCELAPGGAKLAEDKDPDLRPIPQLEEPPPTVGTIGDLGRLIKLWERREEERLLDGEEDELDEE